jgi:hypothetical protein
MTDLKDDPAFLAWHNGPPRPKYHVTVERKAGVTAYQFTPKGPEPMTLETGPIACNCPACLEPNVLRIRGKHGGTHITCTGCEFRVYVPPGPNPSQATALEIIGANDLGETQAGDRRLIVHEGEAMDVAALDALDPPPVKPDTPASRADQDRCGTCGELECWGDPHKRTPTP